METILLTGATGFLGSHLLQLLIEEGYDVIIIKRSSSDLSKIKYYEGKYKAYNIEKVEDLFIPFTENRIDVIIHLATDYGRDSLYKMLYTNVMLPVALLELAVVNGVSLFLNTDTFFAKSQF